MRSDGISKAGWVTLMFGATNTDNFQDNKLIMTVDSANIISHEDYNQAMNENDVALIKLNVPLPISNDNSIKVKYFRTFKLKWIFSVEK